MFGVFRTDARPGRSTALVLSMAFFVLLIAAYLYGSRQRHLENPKDKVMPTPAQLFEGVKKVAIDKNDDGQRILWGDTVATMKRLGIALAILLLAPLLGVNMGAFPYVETLFYRFLVSFWDKVIAMAVIPIIFVVFGFEETAKVALVVIGVFPNIALDSYLRAKEVPLELIQKAKTLGFSEFEICYRAILPQIWPKVIDTFRLNLKSAMTLIIAGEYIAAEAGLGYRTFVVKRYMAMDIIIPYVLWIIIIMFVMDWVLTWWVSRYKWVNQQ